MRADAVRTPGERPAAASHSLERNDPAHTSIFDFTTENSKRLRKDPSLWSFATALANRHTSISSFSAWHRYSLLLKK